jgi:hypothetical protein
LDSFPGDGSRSAELARLVPAYLIFRGKNVKARTGANKSDHSNHKNEARMQYTQLQGVLTSSKEQRNDVNVNVLNVTLAFEEQRNEKPR